MSLHTWRHQSPYRPSSCVTFTLNSHWGRAATGKKKPCVYAHRVFWWCLTLSDPVDCGLPGFSVREGVLQARILERIGQYWLPYPSVAAAAAKSLQSCPTLCDPIDGSSPGSPIPGILQERTLEWVAIAFSSHTLLEHYISFCPSCQLP